MNRTRWLWGELMTCVILLAILLVAPEASRAQQPLLSVDPVAPVHDDGEDHDHGSDSWIHGLGQRREL